MYSKSENFKIIQKIFDGAFWKFNEKYIEK